MKKLFLGLCFVILSHGLHAQSIKGQVIDQHDGSPVNGATIESDQLKIYVANEKGRFQTGMLKPGVYKLKVSSVGFKTLELTVTVPTEPLVISLERVNLFLQPIEVTALRAGDRSPFAKTNISAKELDKSNLGQDLPFLLNQTPSMVTTSDAGNGVGYSSWRIRGTDGTRINMTINGIPYNDPESHATFLVNLPDFASSVNSLQIQRGVGTSSNGGAAFGASINFSTNEFNADPYAEIASSAGSFNTWKNTVKIGSGLINERFTLDARLSKIYSDGYIDRAFSDLKSFYISGAWLTDNASLRLNVFSGKEKTYQAWNGVPESLLQTDRTFNPSGMDRPGDPYDNEIDNYQQDHYQLFYNQTLNSRWKFNLAAFLTKGFGYYEQYKAGVEYGDINLPDFIVGSEVVTETDIIRQLQLDNDFYGGVFSLQHKNLKDEITIGGAWYQYKGDHIGKIIWGKAGIPDDYEWYRNPALKTDINVYSKWQHQLTGRFSSFLDIQYRRVHYEINGFRYNPALKANNNYNFVNPKAGLTYTGENWSAFVSYALGQKEPNRDDFEVSGASPEHEMLHDFELGINGRNEFLKWDVNMYYMRYKNQLVLTGKINDVGAYTRTNIPNSYRMGLELQGSAQLLPWMQLNANLTLSKNRIKDFTAYYDDYDSGNQIEEHFSSTDISFSPAIVGGYELTLTPYKNMELSLPGKYVSRQYMDNTSDKSRSLDAFFVQDARISWNIPQKFAKQLVLTAQVYNLFNTKYEPNGYTFSYIYGGNFTTENYYFPMAGTHFMAGVKLRL
ncbi:MAG TPA: TonB-dependent receptor plug domain-containing protein [Parasegetibacter sp.]